MTPHTQSNEMESLLRDARAAEPSAISADRARELVRRALEAKETRRRERQRRVGAVLIAAAAAIVGVVSARSLLPRGSQETASGSIRTVSGDRIASTDDSEFEVLVDAPERRRVELASGTVLCDVRPLGPGSSFEVDAGATQVLVRGTVFSVTRDGATVVRVYEGRVEVTHRGRVFEVDAGERWSTGDRAVRPLDRGPLADVGEAAAAERERSAELPIPVTDRPTSDPRARPAEPAASATSVSQTPPVVATPPTPATDAPERASNEPAAPARPTASTSRRPVPSDAERAIRDGDAGSALELSTEAIRRGEPGWRIVRADALRALGRHASAADAYDETARLEPADRAESSYAAAILRSRMLHDPAGALRSLDAGRATESSLGERALVLRVRLLVSLGRTDEARQDARRYVDRYGEGGSAQAMHDLLGD